MEAAPALSPPGAELSAAAVYELALALSLRSHLPRCLLRFDDGRGVRLPVERWLAPADAVDERLLDRTAGPVLDVGCGAGRHLHALGRRGVVALGIDSSCVAVALARAGGAHVVGGSVFADVPAAGSWRTVLLLDGSLGIGASPQRLLARAASLLVPGGTVFAELDGPGRP